MKRLIVIVLVSVMAFTGLYLAFPARSLDVLFGDPDTGPIQFSAIREGGNPNQALAAPQSYSGSRVPDIVTTPYDVPAVALQSYLSRALETEPRLSVIEEDAIGLVSRYLKRSPIMAFPDTIDVKFIPIDEETSTIAIYARAKLGAADFGANLSLVSSWLTHLEPLKAKEKSP